MCYDYESKLAEYATHLERANYEIGTLRKKHSYRKKSEDLGNGTPHGAPPLIPRPKSKTNTPQGSSQSHSNSNSKNPSDPPTNQTIPDHILAREKEVWQNTIQQSLEEELRKKYCTYEKIIID